MKRWFVASASLALSLPISANAQPTDSAAQAEILFEDGKTLVGTGDLEHACPKLAESMRLQAGVGVALWLGDCYERQGKTASAWAVFREADAFARARQDPRERIAEDRATKLDGRLCKLVVVVAAQAPKGLVVTRDGIAIGEASLGTEVPVDPGTHSVKASASGFVTWSGSVQLNGDAARARVEVPALVPIEPDQGSSMLEATDPGRGRRIAALTTGAVGVVAVGVGTFFGLRAKSAYDDSNAGGHCTGNACDAVGIAHRDDAFGRATVSTVLFGVGAAALVTAAILYLTAETRAPVTADRRNAR